MKNDILEMVKNELINNKLYRMVFIDILECKNADLKDRMATETMLLEQYSNDYINIFNIIYDINKILNKQERENTLNDVLYVIDLLKEEEK